MSKLTEECGIFLLLWAAVMLHIEDWRAKHLSALPHKVMTHVQALASVTQCNLSSVFQKEN